MNNLIKLPLLYLLISLGCSSFNFSNDSAVGLQSKHFHKKVERIVQFNYLLYLPEQYNKIDKKWPLLLYLHGGSGRGDNLDKIMWYPVPKMLKDNNSFPFIVVCPQCPEGKSWVESEELITLLDNISENYKVDEHRIYLVGYSMGGYGVWFTAYRHPEYFAAIAPMSGMTNTLWASMLKDLPIWVFHGAKDDVVPVEETMMMIDAIEKEGGSVKASIDQEGGHRPPTIEEHEQLFEWLLLQRKVN